MGIARSCSSALMGSTAAVELVDALEAAAGAAPLAEEVEADPSGTLAAAVERRGGMQGVSHERASDGLGRPCFTIVCEVRLTNSRKIELTPEKCSMFPRETLRERVSNPLCGGR